jgi:hypothetical protein
VGSKVAKGMAHERISLLNKNQIIIEMEGNDMLVDV